MRKGVLFSGLLTVFLFCSCSLVEDNQIVNVSPEMVFSAEQSNVLLFDYTSEEQNQKMDFFFDYFKDLKIWKEIDVSYYYAHFIDVIDSKLGVGSFENILRPVLKAGFKVSVGFDEGVFNYEGVYVVSANFVEDSSFLTFMDSFLKKNFEETLVKKSIDGVDYWLIDGESMFFVRKGHNFVFSNDYNKILEIASNFQNIESGFKANYIYEDLKTPFLSFFSGKSGFFEERSFDLAFLLEKNGMRVLAEFPDVEKKYDELSLIDFISGDDAISFIESDSLKNFLGDKFDFNTEKYLGVNNAQFLSLIEGRFSLLVNYEEFFPGIVFYLKTTENSHASAEKFVAFLDTFFEDLRTTLDLELSKSSNFNAEGFVKTEELKNGLKKIYLDFSLLSDEKKLEISSIVRGFNEESKLEIYYGLSETGILTVSVHNDFLSIFNSQSILDSSAFSEAYKRLNVVGASTVSFVNFIKFWDFADNYLDVLYSLGVIADEEFSYKDSLREIFLDKIVSFISAGKKIDDGYFVEMFLSIE